MITRIKINLANGKGKETMCVGGCTRIIVVKLE